MLKIMNLVSSSFYCILYILINFAIIKKNSNYNCLNKIGTYFSPTLLLCTEFRLMRSLNLKHFTFFHFILPLFLRADVDKLQLKVQIQPTVCFCI